MAELAAAAVAVGGWIYCYGVECGGCGGGAVSAWASLVAVDVDYVGQVGFVGSGVSAAYVSSPASVGNDMNYIRRVTLNVGQVVGIAAGVLQLGCAAAGGGSGVRGCR